MGTLLYNICITLFSHSHSPDKPRLKQHINAYLAGGQVPVFWKIKCHVMSDQELCNCWRKEDFSLKIHGKLLKSQRQGDLICPSVKRQTPVCHSTILAAAAFPHQSSHFSRHCAVTQLSLIQVARLIQTDIWQDVFLYRCTAINQAQVHRGWRLSINI